MKRFSIILTIFGMLAALTACKNNQQTIISSEQVELTADTANNLYLGDCFVYDSAKLKYGFVLIKIGKGVYNFAPVSFDSTKSGMDRFKYGKIRVVPFLSMSGVTDEWGTECIGALGQEDYDDFLQAFSKVGRLLFNNKRPGVTGSSYLPNYSKEQLVRFFFMQDSTWTDEATKFMDMAMLTTEQKTSR